jgi:hypothetical protein
MNCQRIREIIVDLARDQMFEAGARKDALEHCENCESCSQALADQRALTATLRSLASASDSISAPLRIEQNLTNALRHQARQTNRPVVNRRLPYWTGAIAASVLIFVAAGLVRWRQVPAPYVARPTAKVEAPPIEVSTPETPVANPEVSQTPAEPKELKATSGKNQRPQLKGVGPKLPKSRSTADVNYASSEIATEFLPLGYGNVLGLQEGGQIVRVEVPRSTLVSFGLPVNLDRVGHRVKADLLLGVDGSARAIRFVQ